MLIDKVFEYTPLVLQITVSIITIICIMKKNSRDGQFENTVVTDIIEDMTSKIKKFYDKK